MGLSCFVSVGRELGTAIERVKLAEALGYESVYVTHIAARDPFTVLTAYAEATERIRLGTGVTAIYARTPVATAQTAATIDEYSGGRMVLGLGVSHRPVVEGWYGQSIDKPVREMREYLGVVRAIFRNEDPPPSEKWPTGFHFMGYEARKDLPIYVAGLSPAMLRLAGELADGVILWLCEPTYIREVVVPEVTKGREKAGKPFDGFDIVAAVPSAVTDDPDAAREVMRKDLTPYFHLPFYRAMIERSGFEPDLEKAAPFIDALAAIGTADEAKAVIDRYVEAGATSPGVGPIAKTDFEATLRALSR
ncbi:MAG: LLM class flavin-dependent oxidoreductase [Thermoleophilaceae bacterium]